MKNVKKHKQGRNKIGIVSWTVSKVKLITGCSVNEGT
jgi:hypothetical protein